MQKNIIELKKYRIVCGLSLLCAITVLLQNHCFAAVTNFPATDISTVSPISTDSSPTVSISLSKTNLATDAVAPGATATASTNVTVNVSNASSYSLVLSFDKTNITSGSTTLTAGNAVTNNTWGYSWDGAASYSTPTTSGSTLSVPALSNNGANFTKTLTLAARFASNATAGHYTANGTLSLTASPKQVIITLADLTQMQQLAEGYAPDACKNTPFLSEQNHSAEYTLTDVRDGYTYTVRKLADGKCWMTQNLKLRNQSSINESLSFVGRTLKNTTSDITAAEWTLPSSSTDGFSSNTASNMYYNSSKNTGYYTWCAATAGTCTSATSVGQNAPSSICPKGWKLPTGLNSGTGTNQFYNLFNSIGLVNPLSTTGSTNLNTAQLNTLYNLPYNFTSTGYLLDNESALHEHTFGYWWSRTAANADHAYVLVITTYSIYPGTFAYTSMIDSGSFPLPEDSLRKGGRAVRCVAE